MHGNSMTHNSPAAVKPLTRAWASWPAPMKPTLILPVCTELKSLTLAEVNPLRTTKTGGSLKIDNYRASRSYCTALEMSC